MSGFLAVATVTAALQKLLGDAVAADVPGGKVTTERPDKAAPTVPTANLYLYQVVPDPFARNLDLPARRADGTLVTRPRAAIDLHYLVSFYGKDSELEPQRLLGSVVRTLNARPLITRELIAGVIADAGEQPPIHDWIATTDLAEADDLVRVCPLPLDLEELSKLWSVFFQTPYTLSTAWKASVVLLEEEDEEVRAAPPPAAAALTVAPLRHPLISRVEVAGNPTAPVTGDAVVRVSGSGLRGDTTAVRVGAAELPVAPQDAGESSLQVDLSTAPAGALRAGRTAVAVVQRQLVGTPPEPRGELVSAPFTLTLRPRATGASVAAGAVTVTTDLTVGAGQRVALQLLDPAGAVVRVLDAPERTQDATSVAVPVAGVPAGSYQARLVVDGAATVEAPAVSLP